MQQDETGRQDNIKRSDQSLQTLRLSIQIRQADCRDVVRGTRRARDDDAASAAASNEDDKVQDNINNNNIRVVLRTYTSIFFAISISYFPF